MGKRFTIFLVPDDNQQIRRFHLSRSLFFVGLGSCVLLLGVFAFLLYRHWSVSLDYAELQRLRVVNGEQRQSLNLLALNIDDLRQDMVELSATEARLRQLAELESATPLAPVAMGGIPESESERDLGDLQQRINQLQVAIDLRRQSQEDVRNLLNDQVSINRATPQGWPVKGWLTSYFGMRKSPYTGRRSMHEGLDIAASTGTSVVATADGVIVRVGYSASYGKMVMVDHGYGFRTLYGHNSKNVVKVGQRVKRGDKVAEVGNTGRSTGSHVHYEILLNSVPIDPRAFL